jgi:ABC-type phosphate/phosphonate transport system substrate-binding protein
LDKVADLMVELIKVERDKHLIETIKQSALNPDKPIKITDKMIKLTEQELEEVFDKIDASEEEREQWKKIYYSEDSK